MRLIIVLVVVIFLGQTIDCKGTEDKKEKDILVGIEYFNGWWEHSPNKWQYKSSDWRNDYPDRIPLLGKYNTQETMDKEIQAAADYGVDFFSILYYYGNNVSDREIKDVPYLNAGLEHFMQSSNSNRMKFMVELCNHPPFAIVSDEDWENCIEICINAMKHPSYLRIDGRSVLKIHGGDQFFIDMGHDIDRCKSIIKRIRRKAFEAGIGDLLITVGAYGEEGIGKTHHFSKINEVDGTMQYMDPTDLPQKETDYEYELLCDHAKTIRSIRNEDILPYVPYFPAGWNPRPWHDPRATFHFPTRKQWEQGLVGLKNDLINSSNLGFRKKDGTIQKAFTIYAWNEFGEGGIVAPTIGDEYMKLEVIRQVFGDSKPPK